MSTEIDVSADPIKIAEEIFGDTENRNDLAIAIRNRTKQDLTINFYIEHGSSKKIPMSNKVKSSKLWKAGVHAEGKGSNIALSIEMSDEASYAVMAVTPPNQQHYFKISHRNRNYETPKSAYNGADTNEKIYSGHGYHQDNHFSQYTMLIQITGASPAVCTIDISETLQ